MLALAVAGCAATPGPNELSYPVNEHLVNGNLVTVEIIRINGTQSPGQSLEKAIATFRRYVVGEVRVVDGESVNLKADESGLLKKEQLAPIIANCHYRGPSDIAILLTPGLSDDPHRGTCSRDEHGRHWIAIQGEQIDETFKIVGRETRWQIVITHELCHTLEVPANRGHAWSQRHCTNPACVLYPRADGGASGMALLRLKPPMDLCADCQREIRQAQQAAGEKLVEPDQPFDRAKWVRDIVLLNPQHDDLLSSMYWSEMTGSHYDTAITCCSVALEDAAPSNRPGWYWRRACAAKFKGDAAAAAIDMDHMMQAIPDTPEELNNAAWKLSTVQGNEHWRDGACAVRLATRACELTKWKSAQLIDTLAAAYAQSGELSRAVEFQNKAIAMADPKVKDAMEQRLALYLKGMPYREKRQ